jgi:hypothetical protein
MPYPDFLYVFGGIIVSIMYSTAVYADNLSNFESELSPTIVAIRANLTSWLPSIDDNELTSKLLRLGFTQGSEFPPSGLAYSPRQLAVLQHPRNI